MSFAERAAGIFFAAAGAVFLIWFILPVFSGIINIGNIAGVILSGIVIAAALRHRDIISFAAELRRNAAGRVLAAAVCTVGIICILTAVILSGLMIGAMNARPDEKTGAVIVLGCRVKADGPSVMLKKRINAAYEFLERNPDAVCVASGGIGSDEPVTEAECIRDELVKAGISESRIYIEDRSESTSQNFEFSAEVFEANGIEKYAVVSTSGFHQFRAKLLAEKYGFHVSAAPTPTAWYLAPTYWVREWFCIIHELIRG